MINNFGKKGQAHLVFLSKKCLSEKIAYHAMVLGYATRSLFTATGACFLLIRDICSFQYNGVPYP